MFEKQEYSTLLPIQQQLIEFQYDEDPKQRIMIEEEEDLIKMEEERSKHRDEIKKRLEMRKK